MTTCPDCDARPHEDCDTCVVALGVEVREQRLTDLEYWRIMYVGYPIAVRDRGGVYMGERVDMIRRGYYRVMARSLDGRRVVNMDVNKVGAM